MDNVANTNANSNVPPIESSLLVPLADAVDDFSPVEDRYYTRFYTRPNPEKLDLNPQCVLLHSNRISLAALSPMHPVVRESKTVVKVDFQVSDTLNRLDNEVRGKGKKGGQSVDENSILCRLVCDDESIYSVRSNVRGKLIEVNQRLVTEPNLVKEKPFGDGFVGVILLKIPDGIDDIKARMWDEETYNQSKDSAWP